jgi:hypothetical protein
VSARLATLVRKRRTLVARAATQRAELAALVERWRRPLAVADTAFRVGLALRRHPALVAVGVALLAPLRGRSALRWGGRLFTLWELYRALREQWPQRGAR